MKFLERHTAGIVTFLLFLFIFLPLLAVIINAAIPGIFFGNFQNVQLGDYRILLDIFTRRLWTVSLQNSLMLGIGAGVLGTIIGGVLATIRAKYDFKLGKVLDISAWVLLIAPSFLIAQGWILFAGSNGLANSVFGLSFVNEFIFTPYGLIFIMGLTKFPLAYITILAALQWSAKDLESAAKINGAKPFKVWRSINIPLTLPAYVAAWTLIFIDTIGDFGLPAALSTVYNFPTLPYTIYTSINFTPVRFDMAGVLSFYLVLILVIAMVILYIAMRKSRVDFLSGTSTRNIQVKPKRPLLVNTVVFLTLLLCIGVPVLTSISVSFMDVIGNGIQLSNVTLENYRIVFDGGLDNDYTSLSIYEGLKNSLIIAIIAGLISVVIGFFVAYVLTFTNSRLKNYLNLFTLVSLAVPGVVLGIGYIFIWNQPWLEPIGLHLYGKPQLLVIAAVAGAVPYAVRVMLGSYANISHSLLDAASMQGAGLMIKIRYIVFPIIRNTVLVAFLASFGTSVFDLALASMLQPPNFGLLPIVIDEAFDRANYGYATASAVVGGAAVILIILVIQGLGNLVFNLSDRRRKVEGDKYSDKINHQ